ncbi:MAG: cobalt-precorrin-5B (C(1))-methyltransferase CbiD [Desulfofustis sp.]|jgi:cobalt-precorrin-5B (C1)-methyltransferase|nr:cobalt-precorrin-5B (C(1))-methyltransferase CbiD [Desulfofustis sp.]
MKKRLRSGFTTGACAAAAAKAAAETLLRGTPPMSVEIPFPDGSRFVFQVLWGSLSDGAGGAAVIKDAGDDPDVTNHAEIIAWVRRRPDGGSTGTEQIKITGGRGVGRVTKPGLAVSVGQPAINPVPLQMIRAAVGEVLDALNSPEQERLEVCIEVPAGEELAVKTLNRRLGIIGGISILGTTGIVRPISAEAWTATIAASMDVAEAAGLSEIVLSTGRTSERVVETLIGAPEEALVMMGDYLDFSLQEVRKRSFRHVHMAAMWAKLLKGAMGIAQTHVRHGMLEVTAICRFLDEHHVASQTVQAVAEAHTAREVLDILRRRQDDAVIEMICRLARQHYEQRCGTPVNVYLVGSDSTVVARA